MTEFFNTYKAHIIYAIIIIAIVCALYFLTDIISRWMVRKHEERFPQNPVKPAKILKRTLNTLWLILGLIALGFIFIDRSKDEILLGYFKMAVYLGIVAVLTIISATLSNIWFKHKIQEKVALDYDPTSYKFLRYVAVSVIIFIGIFFGLMAFPSLQGVAQTALGGAGVIALIAGVASQEALSNLVGGVFIISFKPFRIGDVVKVSDTMVGTVTDITLRHTVIRNFENKMIVIPNAVMNKEKLINYDLGELKCCEHIELNISYNSDITLAKELLKEACENHPLIYDNRSKIDKQDGKPMVRTALTKINDSSYTIRAWAWSRSFGEAFTLKCDVLETIIQHYKEVGIELAYPTRTVYMANDDDQEQIEKQLH